MAMDALQGKVDSVDNQFRQIATELRGYLDHGITGGRKVKPPGTKAGRDLLQHILGRIDQIVSTDLADARRLSISSTTSSPIPQQRAISETDTASSYASPSAASQSHGQSVPQDGSSPQPQQQHQPTPPSLTPVATAPQDKLGEANESLKQSLSHASHLSPTAVKLKADLITPVTPITPGRGPAGVVSVAGQDALACQVLAGPQTAPTPVPPPLRFKLFEHSAPLFDCTYQDIHVLNENLFEQCSSHPVVRDRGYFKLQVFNLPPLNVESMERPTRDHAQSFRYKVDQYGLIKVDTGKKPKFSEPRLPFPSSAKLNWTFEEQRELWNSTAKNPPKGHRPYIIGNPLFNDIDLSPGEKLRQRGEGVLEGINTQYVYFNLTGKTITTMHREDAHVRSENILRSGENKFWCFVKPGSTAKLEEAMHRAYPEMRNCSQAVRHLSRHIPPAQLDEWGVEYTLDYCIPGQAVVTEPGTYHQVLNLGPNYAIAINLEYMSSPDDPPDYVFCDRACPDKFSISAEDFQIRRPPTPPEEEPAEKTKPERSHTTHAKRRGPVSRKGYSADQEQASTGESTNESTPSQEDSNGNLQQRNSTELAPGPTPTLTPERESTETSLQEEPVDQPQAMPQATVDLEPKSPETPQFTETAPRTIGPQPECPVSEHIDQAPEKVQAAPQPEASTSSEVESSKFLAKESPLFAPPQIQRPEPPYQMQVLEQPTPSTLPQAQSQPTNSGVYSNAQNLPNPPIQVPESNFPYTPKLLLPKQAAEQLPVKVRERCENEIPPPVLPQRFPSAVPQLPFTPQYQNTPVSTVHPNSPGAHTLREFSLRPTPPADPVSCEPINAYRAASEVTNMESAGKRRKRQGELPANKKAQKRQKPEPVVTPIAHPLPQPAAQPVAQPVVHQMPVAVDYSHRSAFNHLATLIRGFVVAQADALETAQVCSKVSFERLAGLVRDYRWYSRMYPFMGGGIHLVNHVEDGFQGSHALRVYLSRFSKMKLVDWIERVVGESGPHVASDIHTNRLLSELGWTESERHKLHDYLREGKCWKAICGKFEGVLCLMAPDIPDTQFTELALYQSRIATFHSQLDIPFVRKLCDMGKILEKAIWSDLELPEFIWEAVDTDYLSLNEVFSLLGRFRSIRQNQFHRDKYHWSKPLCWDWNWPADPTSLSPRDKRFCGHCNITAAKGAKTPCHCFEIHVPSIPRISDDGSKGNGIRALGSYKAGSLLGELVGELVPLGTYRSTADWTIQFRRPDLEDHPVAEIYTRDVGNWARKVNHCSTQPSAAFKVMKISGKWRQMLVALRDIKDGEEITAKYGRGYCKEQPYSLVEGFM